MTEEEKTDDTPEEVTSGDTVEDASPVAPAQEDAPKPETEAPDPASTDPLGDEKPTIDSLFLPDFDPNIPANIEANTLFNRATLGVYEMGSTFKIFTTAMALDTDRISIRDRYDATHPIRISRFIIRDYHAQRRRLSIPEIFINPI